MSTQLLHISYMENLLHEHLVTDKRYQITKDYIKNVEDTRVALLETLQRVPYLRQRYNIDLMYYGSMITGLMQTTSDLDLTLLLN